MFYYSLVSYWEVSSRYQGGVCKEEKIMTQIFQVPMKTVIIEKGELKIF